MSAPMMEPTTMLVRSNEESSFFKFIEAIFDVLPLNLVNSLVFPLDDDHLN